ncbi:MAG: YfiM family protein [Desulfotignum sp.]|nr:YfiM family protein [Desulfotignum sp.]MCF8126753.1 YfiM family protein [Desulfotignum sp.]
MRYLLLICILFYPFTASGFDLSSLPREKKVLLANAAGLTAITGWGIANWDYFSTTPSARKEGWFSSNTKEGGADKLGHFYASYAMSHLLAHTYENWGYTRKKGLRLGAISSFAIMNWMELGDSFSDYGFSYEDFTMNALGCAAAWFIGYRPELAEKIDFRVEYRPEFDTVDAFTDYENLKFLTAVKLDGFDQITHPVLKYVELHLGYYARGFPDDALSRRTLYVGIGVNLSRILNEFSLKKLSALVKFIQIPYTYKEFDKSL